MADFRKRVESGVARTLLGLPHALLRPIAGAPVVKDGQMLDRQCQVLLKIMKTRGVRLGGGDVQAERRIMNEQSGTLGPRITGQVQVDDLRLGSDGRIPARRYRPSDGDTLPVLMFLHGGGFVIGDLASHDAVCRALAHHSGAMVIAVDYRLAPENPAPAAAEDAVVAFRDIATRASELGVRAERIAVGGDSAGGNLAAVVAQQTREDAIPPCFQLLFYPVTDFAFDRPSKDLFASGFFLEKASMDWFEAHYIPAERDKKDPTISPIYGDLNGVAPALVQTGGFDPLRDEGEAYAKAMQAASVSVTLEREAGLIHGYLNLAGGVREADAALQRAAKALRQTLYA